MYRYLSLLRLAELIVHNSDSKALKELHNNRTVFYYHGSQPLRLSEFADKLRRSDYASDWCNRNIQILDKAYDLTISKFSNMPMHNKFKQDMKLDGPDCRYYFEAFIKYAGKSMNAKSISNEAVREKLAANALQKLVVRHFRLSCLECCRADREFIKRYLWKLNGHIISVLLPIQISTGKCRKWLEENIPDVDPVRPGERDRVQSIVDRLLTKQKIISLEDVDERTVAINDNHFKTELEDEMTVKGLATVIADEKAQNINIQRPAIRRLGKDKLRHVILDVFENLSSGKYEAMKIADSIGINRTTFTRFAGCSWLKGDKQGDLPIPDLWLNTAQTLAKHPVFVKAAKDAGVLPSVKKVLEDSVKRSRT